MSDSDTGNSTIDGMTRWSIYNRFCGIASLCLLGLTWRLWIPQNVFPQIPLFARTTLHPEAIEVSAPWQWFAAGLLVVGSIGMILYPHWGHGVWRFLPLLYSCGWFFSLLADQHRLQPWAYHFSALALLVARMSPRDGLLAARGLVLGIYFWSALSKLDVQFMYTVGTQFVHTCGRFLGFDETAFSPPLAAKLALLFPLGEGLVVLLLAIERTRLLGSVAVIAMHSILIVLLGHGGLDHQRAVLVWNLFFIGQGVILFWPPHPRQVGPRHLQSVGVGLMNPKLIVQRNLFTWGIVAIMMTAPLFERLGFVDHWLAWALYAPHSSRATLSIDRVAITNLPQLLQELIPAEQEHGELPHDNPRLSAAIGSVRLPIEAWSLRALGVPIYPQARFQLGVAIALAKRPGLERSLEVDLRSAANRFTGSRSHTLLRGLPTMQMEADRFYLGALPSRSATAIE